LFIGRRAGDQGPHSGYRQRVPLEKFATFPSLVDTWRDWRPDLRFYAFGETNRGVGRISDGGSSGFFQK